MKLDGQRILRLLLLRGDRFDRSFWWRSSLFIMGFVRQTETRSCCILKVLGVSFFNLWNKLRHQDCIYWIDVKRTQYLRSVRGITRAELATLKWNYFVPEAYFDCRSIRFLNDLIITSYTKLRGVLIFMNRNVYGTFVFSRNCFAL